MRGARTDSFGPSYMGSMSWQFKKFVDESSKVWAVMGWKDKLAAAFTNSAGMNGDKASTLYALFTMAQQHGMLWVGTGMMPSNNKSSKRDDLVSGWPSHPCSRTALRQGSCPRRTYVDTMRSDKTTTRRRYSAEFLAQVMAECDAVGASVAKVAMAHGINANVVRRWRQLARQGRAAAALSVATPTAAASPNEFVPVVLKPAPMSASVAKPVAAVSPDIRIQLRRGATAVTITWPVSAARECTGWLRELLA